MQKKELVCRCARMRAHIQPKTSVFGGGKQSRKKAEKSISHNESLSNLNPEIDFIKSYEICVSV